MSIKVLRSAALLGVAIAALAMAPVARAVDQGFAPRPDFPGAKQQEQAQPDPALSPPSPRPDFPGPKQQQSDQNQDETPSHK
jgi:hypothetical protein